MFRNGILRTAKKLNVQRFFSSKKENSTSLNGSNNEFKLPEEPTNCCMSGCENCVWIMYAKELTDMYKDSGDTARKIILKKIEDPSMQVFIKMELDQIDQKKSLLETIQTKPPKPKKK